MVYKIVYINPKMFLKLLGMLEDEYFLNFPVSFQKYFQSTITFISRIKQWHQKLMMERVKPNH